RLLAMTPNDIPDAVYAKLEETFGPARRVTLLAFAGQMLATNLLNSAGRVPLDPALRPCQPAAEN
ncbi:MAG: hypothetical protein ABI400_13800, partial [Lacisediminihabitans sp.]